MTVVKKFKDQNFQFMHLSFFLNEYRRGYVSNQEYRNGEQNAGNAENGGGGRGMLYSGECRQTFRRILLNILGKVAKHSEQCPQTFPGMLLNILRNVAKHSRECNKTFWGMSPNIAENVEKYSGECHKKLRGTWPNISGNVANFWCKGQGCI